MDDTEIYCTDPALTGELLQQLAQAGVLLASDENLSGPPPPCASIRAAPGALPSPLED